MSLLDLNFHRKNVVLKQLSPLRRRGVILLGLILSVLVNTGLLNLPIPWLMTLLAFTTVILLPGYIVLALTSADQELGWIGGIPVSFVAGTGLLSVLAVLLLGLQTSLEVLRWLSLLINLILGGLYFQAVRPQSISNTTTGSAPIVPFNILLLSSVILAGAGVIYLYVTTASTWSFGDNWAYLRYIRHYLDQSLTPPANPVSGIVSVAARAINGWWVLLAFVIKMAATEPVETYTYYLPPLLLIISLLTFYSLAKTLFLNQNMALLAVLVQIVYCLSSIRSHDWIGRGFFDRIIEDKFLIWLIILPVATLLMLKYAITGRKKLLWPLALSLIALVLTHPVGLVQAGISWTLFAGVHLLINRQRNRFMRFVHVFLLLLPFLLLPLAQRHFMISQANQAVTFDYVEGLDIQLALSRTRLWTFSALENSYMAHPHLIAHPLTILAILLTPLLIQYLRRNVAAQFLFSNMAGTLLLLYNPITAPLLGRLITPWMLWRISWLLPVSLTVSFFLYKIVNWLQQSLLKNSFFARLSYPIRLLPVLSVILTALFLQGYIAESLSLLQERRVQTMTGAERDLLIHLPEQAVPGSAIMAEPGINTYIPAFDSSVWVLTFRFVDQPAAQHDVEHFYQARLIDRSILKILEREAIRYIIIKRTHDLAFQFELLPQFFVPRYQNAEYALFEVVPDREPNDLITGNTYYIQGDTEAAAAAYRSALALKPDDTLALLGLGQVYQNLGKTRDAETVYQQAIAARPDNVLARLALSKLYAAEGHIETAIDQYQEMIRIRPDYDPVLSEVLGDFHLMEGQTDAAFKQYQKVVTFPAETAAYYLAVGNLCWQKELSTQAVAAFEAVIAMAPHSSSAVQAYLSLGRIYQATGQPEAAMTAYQQVIDMAPDQQEAYIRLSNLYLADGYSEKARALYQQASQDNLNSAWPHVALGYLHYLGQDE